MLEEVLEETKLVAEFQALQVVELEQVQTV